MVVTRRAVLAGGAAGVAGMAGAMPVGRARRLVVAELFTSQGCSSCPPADAVLRDLVASRPDVLALGFHVTYWDRLGWRDPFALEAATLRQRGYAALSGIGGVYTPQMVVDGRYDVVGSDRPGVLAALARAAGAGDSGITLDLSRRDGGLAVIVGAAAGVARGQVLLVGYDNQHGTQVARGENAGRRLVNANVVRAMVPLGAWQGSEVRLEAGLPAGERHAVIVQGDDRRVLAAAVL